MMTDENTYTAPDGTRYRAVEPSIAFECDGCEFNGLAHDCMISIPCLAFDRTDDRNIIWIKETP